MSYVDALLCSIQYFIFCVEMSRQLGTELAWLVRPTLSAQDQFGFLQPEADFTATCIALITTSVTTEVTMMKSVFT